MRSVRLLAFAVLAISLVGIPTVNAQGSWSTVISPASLNLFSVFMVSASEGWAVGVGGTILHYSGGSWSSVTSPTIVPLYSVFMVSASEGWAVGVGGRILHYAGGSWSIATSPTTYDLHSVFMVGASDGWAVGESGRILHYSGGSWSTWTGPGGPLLNSVFMVGPGEGWAVGDGGAVRHYADGSWHALWPLTSANLYSVFMVSANEGWAVGSGGTILHYSGGSWGTVTSPTIEWLSSVFMVIPGEGWAVGAKGTILHYSGGSWSTVTSPTTTNWLNSVFMVCTGEGWAVGDKGMILGYTRPFGKTMPLDCVWTDVVDAPTYYVHYVLPDWQTGSGHTKPPGVGTAALSDFTALGFMYGSSANMQEMVLDTNVDHFYPATGAPKLSNSVLVVFGGRGVNGVVHYYEMTEKTSPVYAGYTNIGGIDYYACWRRQGNVVALLEVSTGQAGTSDMFVVEYFKDVHNNKVFIMYGFTWKGTYNGGVFFKDYMLPIIGSFTHGWYIYEWKDWNGNGLPESNEVTRVVNYDD